METLNLKIYCGNKCNQNCSYCDVEKDQNDDFDKQIEFENFVSKLKQPIQLTLDGGEPFMYPELIDWALKLNVPLTILTNGTLIDENMVKRFNSNITIKISLDGPLFLHNMQRSNYKQVIQTIKLLKKYNIIFDIGTTCTEYSLNFLDNIKSEIDELCPRIWTLTPQMFTADVNGSQHTKQIYNKAMNHIVKWTFPDYGFCLPDFTQDTQEREEMEILFKHNRIEVHNNGYHTKQQRIYNYNEIEDLINDNKL